MTFQFVDTDEESSSNESMADAVLTDGSVTGNEETDDDITIDQNEESDDDESDIIKAIKAEKNKTPDHPPTITSEEFIVDISFHPSRNLIALANILGDVSLYEYSNEAMKIVDTLELHLQACRKIEFNLDGDTMFTTAKDRVIMVTDVETGKLKRCYEDCHEEPVYSLSCLDNTKFVTGDDGGNVKLWDTRQQNPIFDIKVGEEYVSDMITTDAQKYLACTGADGVLTAIDIRGSKIYAQSEEYDSDLTCLGLFRSDTKLLVGSLKGRLYLFNWKEFGYHSDEFTVKKQYISCMVPVTQNIVVTSGEDGVLRATHMFPHRQLGIVGQHKSSVECLDISHDGQFIASCSLDNEVKFWNITYFETIENVIDESKKQNKKKDMFNNLPSSSNKNASDFFSGLV